jgi:short subunit dehydrogenase-like uncharacterized protein
VSDSRHHDVVLYGASGFTGRQTAAYFASHAPAGLRWAIAGRDRARLEAVRQSLGGSFDILVADGADQAAIDVMVGSTRVLLSTAGPFVTYGSGVVDACVRLRTDYADISGETAWVRGLIDRHHEQAARDGTRIVPFCGFDSVPADVGTLLAVNELRARHGTPCVEARAYLSFKGGVNGGTIATAIHWEESGVIAQMRDPFLLNPPGSWSSGVANRSQDVRGVHLDRDIGAWVGPSLVALTDTRVVRRSAALFAAWGAPYGAEFACQEYQKFDPPLAPAKALAMSVVLGALNGALARPWSRRLLHPLVPAPGKGPSERSMNNGWFRSEHLAVGENGSQVRASLYRRGDPSNRATVRFVCEAALCLALERDALPGGAARGGILTPATALGAVLIRRLREAGVEIELWEEGRGKW